jgi:prepilin-type N-terminal cleavage/methylation domain-containing protein
MRAPTRTAAADAGFTLVEVLVAMTVSLVVILASLMTLDAFTASSSEQTRSTTANDQIRNAVDQLVNDLRSSSTLLRAGSDDLVWSTALTATSTRTRRICRSTSGNGVVYRSESTTSTDPGVPCTATGSAGWTVARIGTVASSNSASTGLFSYDGATSSATPATVKAVGLAIPLNTTSRGRASTSVLRTSAAVRKVAGASTALTGLGPGAVQVHCPASGPTIQLSVAALAALGPVTATLASDTGVALGTLNGAQIVTLPRTVNAAVLTVTDALGVTKTISKPIGCQP